MAWLIMWINLGIFHTLWRGAVCLRLQPNIKHPVGKSSTNIDMALTGLCHIEQRKRANERNASVSLKEPIRATLLRPSTLLRNISGSATNLTSRIASEGVFVSAAALKWREKA